ncbi:hypothetical protein Tco_1177765, partial [Tanacetum coccineum]
ADIGRRHSTDKGEWEVYRFLLEETSKYKVMNLGLHLMLHHCKSSQVQESYIVASVNNYYSNGKSFIRQNGAESQNNIVELSLLNNELKDHPKYIMIYDNQYIRSGKRCYKHNVVSTENHPNLVLLALKYSSTHTYDRV